MATRPVSEAPHDPTSTPEQHTARTMQPTPASHDFEGPAGRLEGRLTVHRDADSGAPRSTLPSAVIAHPHPLYGGTMDNLVVRAAEVALIDRGAHTLCFNFRGVGASQGVHDDGTGEQDDLEAADRSLDDALGVVSAEARGGARLWVGYSFGAATVLRRLAARSGSTPMATEIDALLLFAPPLAFYDFSFVDRLHTPLALVCGGADDLTPAEARENAENSWSSLQHSETLDGAGHDLGSSLRAANLRAAIDRCLDHLILGAC